MEKQPEVKKTPAPLGMDRILDEANRMARDAYPDANADTIAARAPEFMPAAEDALRSRPPTSTPSQE